jgi:hypothetical protein
MVMKMEALEKLKESLQNDRPKEWEEIPDIDLYMDQVISYMPRQHIGLEGDETLTSAMVNNYIKKGLLPRANGKKYNKDHLAYLTAICLFKQVISVNETDVLLKMQLEDQNIKQFYAKYCSILDEALKATDEQLKDGMSKEEISDLILDLAVSSYTHKLACQRLLQIMATEGQSKNDGKDSSSKK